jgi:hypothetical protein
MPQSSRMTLNGGVLRGQAQPKKVTTNFTALYLPALLSGCTYKRF